MKRRRFSLMLASVLLMLSAMSCGYLGPEDVPSTALESKQIGPWLYSLYTVERDGLELFLQMGITNTSAQPLVFDQSSVGIPNPMFIVVDAADHAIVPMNDTWHWIRRVGPDQTIRGILRYPFKDAPWPQTLYLGKDTFLYAPNPIEMLFPLE